jgi:hypothetical protein
MPALLRTRACLFFFFSNGSLGWFAQAAKDIPMPRAPWYMTSRYWLAIWAFFGFLNVYALRVNLRFVPVLDRWRAGLFPPLTVHPARPAAWLR